MYVLPFAAVTPRTYRLFGVIHSQMVWPSGLVRSTRTSSFPAFWVANTPLRNSGAYGPPQAPDKSNVLALLCLTGDGAEVQPDVSDLVAGNTHD